MDKELRLSSGLISDFQAQYLKSFGEEIGASEAEAHLICLMELLLITQKPQDEKDNNYEQPTDNTRISRQ